jgi:hypothetical protein
MAEHGALRRTRFALAKFRPTTLPGTLVTRSRLHDRLNAGAGQRLTVVVASAGAPRGREGGEILETIAVRPAARVVILTGAGHRAFAGAAV